MRAIGLFSILTQRCFNKIPRVSCAVYLDDTQNHGPATSAPQMEADAEGVIAENMLFDKKSGQATNWAKTSGWATVKAARDRLRKLLPDRAEVVAEAKQLGVHMVMKASARDTTQVSRMTEAREDLRAVAQLPRSKADKVRFAQTKTAGKIAYGAPYANAPDDEIKLTRTQAAAVVFGPTQKRHTRSIDVVLALLTRGHMLDPYQVGPYQAFMLLRRTLLKHPEYQPRFQAAWRAAQAAHLLGKRSQGPFRVLLLAADKLGWTWTDFTTLKRGPGNTPCHYSWEAQNGGSTN